jgi:hypothetical protein
VSGDAVRKPQSAKKISAWPEFGYHGLSLWKGRKIASMEATIDRGSADLKVARASHKVTQRQNPIEVPHFHGFVPCPEKVNGPIRPKIHNSLEHPDLLQ